MKVLTIVGARPQFIKAAAVSRSLVALGIDEQIVHTGQHYDEAMSGKFFDELEIPRPVVNLNVGSGSHAEQTAGMLVPLETEMLQRKPDWVLVYGDTNSTLAGALAASKIHVPVAHVEAGLRSFNRSMPEELNRIVTDHLADLLFAPTSTAITNLNNEGLSGTKVVNSGDVMFDVALRFGKKAEQSSDVLDKLNLTEGNFALATVHRAENTDDPVRLKAIANGLARVAESTAVVLPLHPRTRAALKSSNLFDMVEQAILLTEPLGYLDMLLLQRSAAVVVTDSGGVQKEAYFQGVPCVTLRDETEWVELVEAGWNTIVPPIDAGAVASAVTSSIGKKGRAISDYGTGHSAEIIAKTLMEFASEN